MGVVILQCRQKCLFGYTLLIKSVLTTLWAGNSRAYTVLVNILTPGADPELLLGGGANPYGGATELTMLFCFQPRLFTNWTVIIANGLLSVWRGVTLHDGNLLFELFHPQTEE